MQKMQEHFSAMALNGPAWRHPPPRSDIRGARGFLKPLRDASCFAHFFVVAVGLQRSADLPSALDRPTAHPNKRLEISS
ncbi:MAG: hypothetical protein Q7V56_02065 [Gammaproteobacteria bacterium]|nr:hypothetical protein [Gammaproteobacteria bacterium]